jgi:hypothetical protein
VYHSTVEPTAVNRDIRRYNLHTMEKVYKIYPLVLGRWRCRWMELISVCKVCFSPTLHCVTDWFYLIESIFLKEALYYIFTLIRSFPTWLESITSARHLARGISYLRIRKHSQMGRWGNCIQCLRNFFSTLIPTRTCRAPIINLQWAKKSNTGTGISKKLVIMHYVYSDLLSTVSSTK